MSFLRLICVVALMSGLIACRTMPLEEVPAPAGPDALRVVTWNVHFDDAAAPQHEREERAREVCVTADRLEADILCLQEVATTHGPVVLEKSLLEVELRRMIPAYEWISPRGAASLSTSNPILYRKNRFLPVRQGVRWFSDTPNVPDSTHWGNVIPRYAVWAVFYDHATGAHFLVINTHLDHLSAAANRQSVAALLALVEEEADDSPIVVAGDFNAVPFSSVQREVCSYYRSVLKRSDPSTWNGLPLMQIDGIFVSEEIIVLDAAVVDTGSYGTPSDHRPVVADLGIRCSD